MQLSNIGGLSWSINKIVKAQIQQFKPALKINPFLLINKIQQAKPSYKSNLINKQIAYDVIIDTQQNATQKIKDCICAARPNSQIYKRISKSFLYNLKNGINQMLFFTGNEICPRLQTSIGLSSNPGMFMIAAIAILDQKYKQNHQRCDVQISFLQFREGQLYDLLNYTKTPLKIQQKVQENIISFNQQNVKVFTFLQFIKLFKIALFNNKQRDFKTESIFKSQKQLKSTFIMKVKTKIFNLEGQQILSQETALVDYDQGCYKAGKQKQGKNLLDYLLIQINNSNPTNKPIHYHKVQKNPFINFFKSYLRCSPIKQTKNYQEQCQHLVGGQLMFINSFSSNKEQFKNNLIYLQNIYSYIGDQWQGKVLQSHRWNNYFNSEFVKQKFEKIIHSIIIRNYSNLSEFYQIKEFYNQQVKKLKNWIKQYKKVIYAYSTLKRDFRSLQNMHIGYELQLVGSCIKSDNFKDFYHSKSYISLNRQIQIKTQDIKSQIITCFNSMLKLKDDFGDIKKKEFASKNLTIIPQIIKTNQNFKRNVEKNVNSQNKFKPLLTSNTIHVQFNELQAFFGIKTHIFQYIYLIWDKINIFDERTLVQELIFQQCFIEELENMNCILSNFVSKMQKIRQSQIICHKNDLNLSKNNFYHIIRSFNLTKQQFLKSKRLSLKHFNKQNKQLTQNNMRKTNYQLPKLKVQLPKLRKKFLKLTTEFNSNKLQDKQNEDKIIHIKGKVDFAKMILNPSCFDVINS